MQVNNELTNKQSAALALLLTGMSVEQAANAVNVNPSTLHRWIITEPFASEYRQRRRQLVEQATVEISAQARAAAQVMCDVMNNQLLSATVRLRAAQAVYNAALQWREMEDLESRVTALEAGTQ